MVMHRLPSFMCRGVTQTAPLREGSPLVQSCATKTLVRGRLNTSLSTSQCFSAQRDTPVPLSETPVCCEVPVQELDALRQRARLQAQQKKQEFSNPETGPLVEELLVNGARCSCAVVQHDSQGSIAKTWLCTDCLFLSARSESSTGF